MPKLYELLSQESTASTQAEKCRADLMNTFEKKRHLFGEKLVTFTPSEENARAVTEEQSTLQSTVPSELKWLTGIWARAIDLAYQVDHSNMEARADIVLDDNTVIAKDVPATALLRLEKRASEVHQFIGSIPTLDPAKGFVADTQRGEHIYKAREETKTRTKKTQRPIVLYPATIEHPAQTQLLSEDVPIGTITTQEWSGMITPAQKGEMLERADELRRAIKAARSRASAVDAATAKIATDLLRYAFEGRNGK